MFVLKWLRPCFGRFPGSVTRRGSALASLDPGSASCGAGSMPAHPELSRCHGAPSSLPAPLPLHDVSSAAHAGFVPDNDLGTATLRFARHSFSRSLPTTTSLCAAHMDSVRSSLIFCPHPKDSISAHGPPGSYALAPCAGGVRLPLFHQDLVEVLRVGAQEPFLNLLLFFPFSV